LAPRGFGVRQVPDEPITARASIYLVFVAVQAADAQHEGRFCTTCIFWFVMGTHKPSHVVPGEDLNH
jgi:hypothetical protein